MQKLDVVVVDSDTPIILFSGNQNPLIKILINLFHEDFKIAYVSDNTAAPQKAENFYRIETGSAYLIKNLEEKIDYGVIFLEEERDKRYIPHLFEKLEADQTRVAVIIPVEQATEFTDIITQYKKNPNFYFLFEGDVYSENNPEFTESKTGRIIRKTLTTKSFNLEGKQDTPLYPIYLDDAIVGINQILFGKDKKQRFYFLFYEQPQNYLSAIHIIKRIEPDLLINFDEDKSKDEAISRERLEQVLSDKAIAPFYLDRYLQGFEKSLSYFSNPAEAQYVEEKERKPKSLPNKRQIKFSFKALFLGALFYLALSCLVLALGLFSFKLAVDDFRAGRFEAATQNSKNAKVFIDASSPNIRLVALAASAMGVNNIAEQYNNLNNATTILDVASRDFDNIKDLLKGLNRETLDQLISDASYIYFKTNEIKATTHNPALNEILTPAFSKFLNLAQVAPDILGYNGERNYLILFQNNGELRPTGGFIGSVGLANIKNGKIQKLTINDVYDFDGQLKQHVEPYYIVRRYLQPNLYLRDSNFDPDFQTTASESALIYNLEGGKQVDGVIAVNYDAIKQIIGALGPIKLSSYNKTIDENNAFDFLQSTIDDNFFPGSSAKRDVLNSLYNEILLRVEGNKTNMSKLAKLFPKLVLEKNILFAFNAGSVQSIFSATGLGGEYKDTRESNPTAFQDFLAVNEANIGQNKANIDVSRKTEYTISFKGIRPASTVTQTLTNTGDKDYTVYLRFFVPHGSNLTDITINGQKQTIVDAVTEARLYEDKRFKKPVGLEVDRAEENNLQVFGFITTVPKKANQLVTVSYNNGATLPGGPVLDYSLLIIKQPGVEEYPFVEDIEYPDSYTTQSVKNATLSTGNIEIKREINQDEELKVKFIKKR